MSRPARSKPSAPPEAAAAAATAEPSRVHATLAYALSQLSGPGDAPFAKVLAHGTMRTLIFRPTGNDTQGPHDQDEVYLVSRGSGTLVHGATRHRFGPGDVLFVPARIAHHFENFSGDFATWVIFYGPKGGEADAAAASTEVEARR